MENKKISKKAGASVHCELCGMRHENINELNKHMLTHKQPAVETKEESGPVEEAIIRSIEKSKTKGRLQWGSMTVTFILIILTSVSILQALESYNVMKKIEGGNFGSGSSSAAVPSSIDSLPNMVGGC
ncbi:MAG: hypothetical protein WC788_06830 [Candidatus Paceibacterota bacterium]|jgi:hypothetical protein